MTPEELKAWEIVNREPTLSRATKEALVHPIAAAIRAERIDALELAAIHSCKWCAVLGPLNYGAGERHHTTESGTLFDCTALNILNEIARLKEGKG